MVDFKFPDVGEGITEGEIVKWKVKVGDKVKEDDVLADVETDKAIVQIPSPASGTVTKILFKEGDTVKVGQVMVQISEGKFEGKKEPQKEMSISKQKKGSVGVVGELEEAPEEEEESKKKQMKAIEKKEEAEETNILALPAVRAFAKELGVDLSEVRGTGKDGSITKEDIEGAANTKKTVISHPDIKVVKKYDFYGYIEHIPLHGLRKTIAKNMVEAQKHTASVTHMDEADVTHLVEIREKEKKRLEKQNIRLTFLPFIIKAIVKACEQHPLLNAIIDEDAQEIIIKRYYNVGIAVDTEEGLIVPVIKRAKEKSIPDIAKEIETLAELARTRKIDLADLQGGTITITSVGSVGGIFATPIINYPEVANLGIGKIQEKPVVRNGKIVIRSIMPIFLTFDHRLVDGAEAARFVNVIKEHLEDPDIFLIEP